MDEKTLVAILVPLGFLVGFPLIWIGVCQLSAFVSGWRALASRYRATTPLPGKRIEAPRSQIGFSQYRNALTAHVSPEGLGLSVSSMFPGHAPLLFPWSDLHDVRSYRPLIGKPGVTFRVGPVSGPLSKTFYIPAAVFEHPDVPPAIRAVAAAPQARTA